MNKSIIALLMALVLCVSLVGCQKKAEEPAAVTEPAPMPAPAVEQPAPPAEGMPAEGTAAAPEAAAPAAPAPEGSAAR